MMNSRPVFFIFLFTALLLAACGASPTPAPAPAASATALPNPTTTPSPVPSATPSPTATQAPTATATPTPLPALPAALGTPALKPGAVISAASAAGLRELARWGKGRAELVEYSPDGRWLVVKTAQGSYVYSSQDPSQGQYLEGSLTFASKGGAAVSVRRDGQVELWQVDGWKRVAGWAGSRAAFSPDGKLLAFANPGAVLLVEAASGKAVQTLEHKGVERLAFVTAGQNLVSASRESFRVWQVSDGKRLLNQEYERVMRVIESGDLLLAQVRTHQGEMVVETYRSADWSPAATIVASGTLVIAPDGTHLYLYSNFPTPGRIEIYRLPDGSRLGETRAGGSIYRLAISPDSKMLAASMVDFSASNQQTYGYLKTFDADGKEFKRLDCGILCDPQQPVFSPDGKMLAVAGVSSASGIYTGSVFLFNAGTGERLRMLRGPRAVPGAVERVAFAPDGQTLATLSGRTDDAVRIWKTADATLVASLEWSADTLYLSDQSADGRLLATYSDAGQARLLSTQNGAAIAQFERSSDPRLSPRGDWVAATEMSNGQPQGVRLFRANGGDPLTPLPRNLPGPLVFSPAEDLGALVNGFSIQLVRLPAGSFAGTLNATGKPNVRLTAAAFSPDGKLLAAGSASGEVWLWQTAEKKQFALLEGHKNSVNALLFSRDGATLITGSSEGVVNLWEMPGGRLVKSLNLNELVHRNPATEENNFGQLVGLALSPDGSLLAASGKVNPLQPAPVRAGVTALVSLEDGVLLRLLAGGGSASFAPDGKLLYTGGDGALHLWGLLP